MMMMIIGKERENASTCGLSPLKSDTGTSKLGGEFFRVWLLAMLVGSHFSFKSPLAAESPMQSAPIETSHLIFFL